MPDLLCLAYRDGDLGAVGCGDRPAGETRSAVAENQGFQTPFAVALRGGEGDRRALAGGALELGVSHRRMLSRSEKFF